MLDVRKLRLLQEFARLGTIAATAAVLDYSASAVSQQLAALEREAGVALLIRGPRSAELTDAGWRLAARATRILSELEAAETDLAAHAGIPSGRVVISAFPTAAIALAPDAARSLRQYPNLSLVVRQAPPEQSLDRLRAGEIEVALVDDWSGEWTRQATDSLQFVELLRDPLVLVVPREHTLAHGGPIDLAALAEQPWVAAPPDEPSRRALHALFVGIPQPPNIAWEFQGLDTVVNLVAQGLGIAITPRMAVALHRHEVVGRALPSPSPVRTVYAVARTASTARPAVAAVLDALRQAAAAHLKRFRHDH
jgi:DNA-binding transcriptional LysR family regulator